MSTTRQVPIAEIMPGVTIGLADTDMVTTAICIALVVPMEAEDPSPGLVIATTPGTTWITQRGMLHAALDIERAVGDFKNVEDGDE